MALFISGCDGGIDSRRPRSEGELARTVGSEVIVSRTACPAASKAMLSLVPAHEPLRFRGMEPIHVVGIGASQLVMFDPDSARLVFVDAEDQTGSVPAPGGGVRNLLADGDRVFLLSESTLFRIAPGSEWLTPVASIDHLSSRIVSAGLREDQLWLVDSPRSRETTLRLLSLTDGRAEHRRSVPLPGPAHVTPAANLVLATLVNPPFSVIAFDDALRELHRINPPIGDSIGEDLRGRNSVFSLGLLSLDCGYVLQMLTDLRSDDRWLVLYSVGSDGLNYVRQSLVDLPIGFVHSVPSSRTLIGMIDSGSGREIVRFQWHWQTPNNEDES